MKKILIVNNNMHIGGVQRALADLLPSICAQYEITLLLFHPVGEYLADIPQSVKLLTPGSAYRFLGMTREDAKKHFAWSVQRAFFALVTRLFGRKYATFWMGLGQKTLRGYDVAISYLHDGGDKVFYGGCNAFVLRHVAAPEKIAFLHCDYRKCGAETAENAAQYARFDRIAACSEGCGQSFAEAVPHLREKVFTVHNCQDFARIRSAAERAPMAFSPAYVQILTVARLGREKGVARAIRAIAQLGDAKEKLRYCIIGDGIERGAIEALIRQLGLCEIVTLCGALPNPYGYMQAADLLLIPSYSEAAPLVIGEAASLGTPILSTETASAKEMITQTGVGWVCKNSVEGIADMLRELIADPLILVQKKEMLRTYTQDNHTALAEFAKLLGDAETGVKV